MIKFFNILLSTVLLLVLTSSLYANTKIEPLDRIVATVNDSIITESELDDAMNTIKKQTQNTQASLPPVEVFRKKVLDQLINKKLQMQMAEQAGVHVTDVDVDKAIHSIAENNKVTVKELYEKVAEQDMTPAEYRKELKDEILLQQVQQQAVGSRIVITPQEVKDFMRSKSWHAANTTEYHLEDILVPLPETPTSQDVVSAKKRAEAIVAKIKQGTDFHEISRSESQDSPLQGGDLGWRKLPEIPSAFAEEIIHLKQNDLIGPIQTSNGFHIVKLSGLRNINQQLSENDQLHQVEQLIFQRKLEENLQSWVTKLRSEAFIHINHEG